MKAGRLTALGVAGLLGLAGVASATPVTYTYTSGDVVITNISLDGVSVLAGSSSPEFGFTSNSTATIDTQADTLAFLLDQSSTAFQAGLMGTFTGGAGATYNLNAASVALSGIHLSQPTGTTLALTQVGSGYTFAAPSGITVSGNYDLENLAVTKNGKTTDFTSGVTAFGPANKAFSGSASLFQGDDTLQVDGLSLGTWTVDGQTLSVTGNVIFNGMAPVPLPASLWMLISGVGLLGLTRSKRRG